MEITKKKGGIDRRRESDKKMKRVPQLMGQDVSKIGQELNRRGG